MVRFLECKLASSLPGGEGPLIDYPKTLAEAQAYRYGRWAGNERGNIYRAEFCAMEIPAGHGSYLYRQCSKANGHGLAALYCRQHAKKVERHG